MTKESLNHGFSPTIIFYSLIVLFCMNFFENGSLLCLIFCIYSLLRINIKINIDFHCILSFLLTIVAFIASFIYFDYNIAIKSLNFFLIYIVGYNYYYLVDNKVKFIKNIIFSIFLGYSILTLLTFIYNYNTKVIDGQRTILNIWTGEYISVTLIGLLSSVVIGYSFYCFFIQKKIYLKCLAFIFLTITILINMKTATRTPILLLAITYIVLTLIYIFSTNPKKSIKFVAFIIFLFVIFFIFYHQDYFDIKTNILNSPLFKRVKSEKFTTGRIEIFYMHLLSMNVSYFGGGKISNYTGHLAHNFLQEGYDLYGIFGLLILMLIFFSFIRVFCELLLKSNKNAIDYLLISMYISMIIQSFLEPIFSGYPCYFFCLLLIHSIATAYVCNYKKSNLKQII